MAMFVDDNMEVKYIFLIIVSLYYGSKPQLALDSLIIVTSDAIFV